MRLAWIVIVGSGSWRTCFGTFDSYDAAVDWLRANGWTPADQDVLPIRPIVELAPTTAGIDEINRLERRIMHAEDTTDALRLEKARRVAFLEAGMPCAVCRVPIVDHTNADHEYARE